MFEPDFDVAVIGAGVVGLACAEALAHSDQSTLVLERHARIATETSSRNSGVVHAGLYYPPGSLKATLCIRGRRLLEERSLRQGFRVRKTGKLIVATRDDELPALEALLQNARAAGVSVHEVDKATLQRLEPAVRAAHALLSPESGIVDVGGLVASYRREALAHGVTLALGTRVTSLQHVGQGWSIETVGLDGTVTRLTAPWVVNAAGLSADQIATMAGVDVAGLGLVQYPCKGSYFSLSARWTGAISRLVYPLPTPAGLGIHLTLDLAGNLRAGPDARYVTQHELTPDESARALFADSLRRYLPELRDDDLSPAYAGLRPKLAGPGEPFRDFAIRHESVIGLPGLINLLGIESPGLTASPAIAERVAGIVSGTDVAT